MPDEESIDYVSSVLPYAPEKGLPSIDAPDEKALERVADVLSGQIALYHTIDGVKQFDKTLTLEQRFELTDHYVNLLKSLSTLVNNAINDIKENQA